MQRCGRLGSRFRGEHADEDPIAFLLLERNFAVRECEKGEITTAADVLSRMVQCAHLANEDVTGANDFAAETLHATTLSA